MPPSGRNPLLAPSTLSSDPASSWRPKAIELLAILTVWALFAALSAGRIILDPDRAGTSATTNEILFTVAMFASWAIVTPGIFWIADYLGTGGHLQPWQRILLHAVAAVSVSIAVDIVTDVIRNVYLQVGPDTVASVWASVRVSIQEAWALGFIYELIIYAMILAVGFARAYYRRLQERRVQATELRAQLTEARLQALRMQINPHFLFNTLNAVSGLVERDPKGVRTMVARLSALLRHTLTKDGQDGRQEVPLDEELTVLNDYLEIMHVRFGDRLHVRQDIDDSVRDALVPDLILQPLVENAIKHGVAPQERGGRVTIQAQRTDGYLQLSVADDGPGMAGDGLPDTGEGIGLRNVKERLRRLYGTDHRMQIRPGDQAGVVVDLRIPFHTRPHPPTRASSPAADSAPDPPVPATDVE
mgnify:FL=1